MNTKSLVWIGMIVGSVIGGYVPALWGAGVFSFPGIIGNTVGGILGIFAGYKLSQMI
jgi:hypothetical protein